MDLCEPQSTERRTALLRRVDWRLLLPCPRPRLSVAAAHGALVEAVRSVSERVCADLDSARGCDLVVAIDPDAAVCRAAHRALAPQGWIYVEWRRPFRIRASAARRRLEQAGFTDVICYWRWRTDEMPRAWLPLQARGALRHFWRIKNRPGHTMRNVARHLIWTVARMTGLLVPIVAIGQKPGDSPSTRERDRYLLGLVRDRWSQWGLGEAPGRLSCLLVTGGNRAISKCVGLIFEEPDPRPRLAIKLPRVPESVPALAKEAAVLDALHSRYPAACAGIPRLLQFAECCERTMLVETALTGTPLEAVVTRGKFRALALQGTDWLADFAGRTARVPRDEWRLRIARPAIADFADNFHGVADPQLLEHTRAMLGTVGALPRVVEQRDCSPWNVLVDPDGALVVLDWESAELDGLPALDLIYFIAYLAFALDGVPIDTASERLRASYRRLLDPASFTGRVRRDCMARYAERIGLEPADIEPLAALTWLIHARSDYRRFTADAAGRPHPERLRQSVFLALWEEEVRHALPAHRVHAPRQPLAVTSGGRQAYGSQA